MQANLKQTQTRQPIDAEFRVMSFGQQVNQFGETYIKYTLENAQGQIKGFEWRTDKLPHLLKFEPIRVRESVRRHNDTPVIDTQEVESLWLDEPEEATRLLPRSQCHHVDALDRLVSIYESIQSPPLRRFCDQAFNEMKLAIPFMQRPASNNHHHNIQGGLLLHSVEVAEYVSAIQTLSEQSHDIATVAAIFHDIGKIRTLSRNTETTLYIDHEIYTLELLCHPLSVLEQKHLRIAEELRYCWTSRIPATRQRLVTEAARALKTADHSSAQGWLRN